MNIKHLIFIILAMTAIITPSNAQEVNYVVLARTDVIENAEWNRVATTLANKHRAEIIRFAEKPEEALPRLKQIRPKYVAIVDLPKNIGVEYVQNVNRMARNVDDDIYADFMWGIITGYNAEAAMRMVNNATEPLVIKSGLATITETKSAKWFDRYAWIEDHERGVWGEKTSADKEPKKYNIEPGEILKKFTELYAEYDPDLIITASHATENNLEMPYSLGNIKAENGHLYADLFSGHKPLKESGKRRVYLPIGNCLIGNVNNTENSMAIAWMNSANVATFVGYVVPTWYGRNGWGGLKYFLTHSGRYTLAEAFYLNLQDMMYQMNEWNDKLHTLHIPFYQPQEFMYKAEKELRKIGITQPTKDILGFLHDRDVVAFYGDPAWNVRLQEIKDEKDFSVSSKIRKNQCIITVKTKKNFSLERMQGDHFKEEHVLDLPFSYIFPERLKNPRLAEGQKWKAALAEDFILIYAPKFESNKTYKIVLDIDK